MKTLHRFVSFAVAGGIVCGAAIVGQRVFAEDKKDTDTIKHVMKVAHSGDKKNNVEPLCKIIISGKGTHENADELLKLYKELAAAMPPKGDEADWKKRTGALVAAAEELDKGDKPAAPAIAAYKTALDCKGCHTEHRPAPAKK